MQIDAAINRGTAASRVQLEGEAGVAFQSFKHDDAENIGYVIPTPVIVHFITDYDRKKYTGFPTLGLEWQKLENPNMRKYLNMKNRAARVFVRRVSPVSEGWENLQTTRCAAYPWTACPSGTTEPCAFPHGRAHNLQLSR